MSWHAQIMYLPPPPGQPACAGLDPAMFTEEPITVGAHMICQRCPTAVQKWCLDVVRPSRSHFTGLCGGDAWNNGQRRKVEL